MTRQPGKHALVFVAITVLLDTVGFGLVIPVMPALLVELTRLEVNRAAVYGGWLAFAYAFTQFLCAPVLGNLSDRFGRRPVLLFAVFALGIDYLIMGMAPSLGWLFVGRTIAGIAWGSCTERSLRARALRSRRPTPTSRTSARPRSGPRASAW